MSAPALGGLHLSLQPKQALAFTSRATEILFGGAAGGGKSMTMRACAIAWALLVPGLQIALFRRFYPDLVANHMEGPMSFPALLAPLVAAGQCRIVKGEITFPNGSRISLNHCQYPRDVYRFQGAEFHALLIDEITHWTEPMYRFLRGRCRMTGITVPPQVAGLFPRVMCSGNPGGVGHVWVKRTWVQPGPMITHRAPPEEGGMLRQYIPSKLSDNPALLDSDPDYASRLMGLGDPLLVRAMLDGDWRIAAGSMFGETWRDELHTCDPFPIPVDWPIWFGGDDGFADPSSIHYLTQHPSTQTFFVIAPIHQAGLLAKELGERMLRMEKAIPRWMGTGLATEPNTAIIKGLYDSAAWADHGGSDSRGQKAITRGAQLEAVLGSRIKPVEKWDGSRVHGVQNFHLLMAPNERDPKRLPGIRFFKTCRQAIESIQALPRDKNNNEDVDTNADDHCFVAGTLVQTDRGPKAIETIRKGDMIATRLGFFPVLWTSTRTAEVINARGLTGSPEHTVWTNSRWKSLDSLTQSDTLYSWQKFMKSSSIACVTAVTLIRPGEKCGFILSLAAQTAKKAFSASIRRFTKRITAPFLRAATFITGTKTPSTTRLRASNSSPLCNTARGTPALPGRHALQPIWPRQIQPEPPLGIEAQKAGPGTAPTPKPTLLKAGHRSANSAEPISLPKAQLFFAGTPARPSGAEIQGSMTSRENARSAERLSIPGDSSQPKPAGRRVAVVYNFAVDGPPEYFANGVLVHNCWDSVRYALQYRLKRMKLKKVG